MKFIIKPECKGKTTDLIKIAYDNNAYMIVPTKNHATQVFHYARKIGYDILFPISVEEILKKQYFGKRIKAFVIDDIERFIKEIIPVVPVIAVAGTQEKNNF